MKRSRSLDYEYRATQQRLLGIERQLDERWSFRLVVDRYDAEADLRRIERAMKRQTITATIAYDKEHHLSVA